jgi:hypothetical protein
MPDKRTDSSNPHPAPHSSFWGGSRVRGLVVPFLLALFVVIIHSPALTHEFAVTDAYNTLDMAQRDALRLLHNGITITGRPITSLFVVPAFRLIEDVGDLAFIRAGALMFAVGFFLLLYGFLRRLKISPIEAGCFSLVIGLTPAFCNYVTWTVQWPYPLGAALAMLAGWMTFHAFLVQPVRTRPLILAGLLLFCIPMIYQLLPGYFMLPVVALCLFRDCDARRVRAWALSLAFYFCCMVAYVLAFKIYDWTIAQEAWPEHAARNQITGDLLGKADFLGSEILPKIFASWSFYFGETASLVVELVVLALCLIGLVPLLKKASLPASLLRLLLLGCAAGLTIAPLVATSANQAPTRTLGPAVSIVALMAVTGLWHLMRRFPGRWAQAGNLAVVSLAGMVGATAFSAILWGLAIPQEWELQTIRQDLHKLEEAPGWVAFVHPREHASPRSPIPVDDTEYNFNSSFYEWVPAPMMNILVKEKVDAGDWAPPPLNYVFVAITPADYPQPVVEVPVIHAQRLLFGMSPEPVPEPVLNLDSAVGRISSLMYPDDYYYSPWLGYFYSGEPLSKDEGMTLFMPRFGSLVLKPTPGNDVWLWVPEQGWALTGPETYPSVRMYDSGEVLQLVEPGKYP